LGSVKRILGGVERFFCGCVASHCRNCHRWRNGWQLARR
jgi:hypothetical protein